MMKYLSRTKPVRSNNIDVIKVRKLPRKKNYFYKRKEEVMFKELTFEETKALINAIQNHINFKEKILKGRTEQTDLDYRVKQSIKELQHVKTALYKIRTSLSQ
jgi:hypothetical protein